LGPAHAGDTVLLTGKLTRTGNTSMEVCVKTYVEALNGSRKLVNTAYLVMVALDANEKPASVPKLVLETDEEKNEWEQAGERERLREKRNEK